MTTFTEKEFFEQIVEFRKLFGSKDFWERPIEIRDAAVRGISFVYFNIVNDDGSKPEKKQINKWAGIFDATIQEYSRRGMMLGKIT